MTILIFAHMNLDILAFGAHPDDVELAAGATLAKHVSLGYKVGIIDLTRGELGTRGTPEIRDLEAIEAGNILGVSIRENLCFRDGFFQNDEPHQLKIIQKIRQYRPKLVLANALNDRHPDHGKAGKLVSNACFLAGLRQIKTQWEGQEQEAWRPLNVLHYIQFYTLTPDLILDVSGFIDQKEKSIWAHKSQFYNPNSNEPETLIAKKGFVELMTLRSKDLGISIGAEYAEGFNKTRSFGVKNLLDLV
jgi:bacillithiol biosynthesis deacetylase BshB1